MDARFGATLLDLNNRQLKYDTRLESLMLQSVELLQAQQQYSRQLTELHNQQVHMQQKMDAMMNAMQPNNRVCTTTADATAQSMQQQTTMHLQQSNAQCAAASQQTQQTQLTQQQQQQQHDQWQVQELLRKHQTEQQQHQAQLMQQQQQQRLHAIELQQQAARSAATAESRPTPPHEAAPAKSPLNVD